MGNSDELQVYIFRFNCTEILEYLIDFSVLLVQIVKKSFATVCCICKGHFCIFVMFVTIKSTLKVCVRVSVCVCVTLEFCLCLDVTDLNDFVT